MPRGVLRASHFMILLILLLTILEVTKAEVEGMTILLDAYDEIKMSNDPEAWWTLSPAIPRWAYVIEGDKYVPSDPINIIIPADIPIDTILTELRDDPSGETEDNWPTGTIAANCYIYDYLSGIWKAQDYHIVEGADITDIGNRMHIRLWKVYSPDFGWIWVGNVHIEEVAISELTHEVLHTGNDYTYGFEEAEHLFILEFTHDIIGDIYVYWDGTKVTTSQEPLTNAGVLITSYNVMPDYVWTVVADCIYLNNEYNRERGTLTGDGYATIIAPFRRREPSIITISASSTVITIGESITFSGDIDPDPGVPVRVTIKISGSLSTTLTTPSDERGRYSVVYTPSISLAPYVLGTYRVYAEWEGTDKLAPAISSIIEFTVKKKPSKIVVTVEPSEIRFGERVRIGGYILPSEAGANRLVTLEYIYEGIRKLIATVKANANARFEYEFKPPNAGDYDIIASWTGTVIYDGANASAHLKVLRAPSEINITINSSEITLEESIIISGVLKPPLEGIDVTVEYSYEGGPWVRLAIIKTEKGGFFSYKFTPEHAGNYSLRASWNGTRNYEPATSSIVRLTVKHAPTNITIVTDRETVYVGEDVTVAGTLKSWKGRPLAGFEVILKVTNPESTVYEYKTKTNEEGGFELAITIDTKGIWNIQAIWLGNKDYLRNETRIIKVIGNVTETLNIVITKRETSITERKPTIKKIKELTIPLDIGTNSTLKEAIMKDSLRVKVEGPRGATGFLILTVPKEVLKQLGITVGDIRTFVEGKLISFKHKETQTKHILMVTYKHSSTTMVIEVRFGHVLVLKVVDYENNPLRGAIIELRKAYEQINSTYSDNEGKARFLMLPKGTYIVRVFWRGSVVFEDLVNVTDDLQKTLSSKVFDVHVVVKSLLGLTAPGIRISMELPDETTLVQTTGDDGSTSFEQIPSGTYSIVAHGLTTDVKSVFIEGSTTVTLKVMTIVDLMIIIVTIVITASIITIKITKRKASS